MKANYGKGLSMRRWLSIRLHKRMRLRSYQPSLTRKASRRPSSVSSRRDSIVIMFFTD
jgi:hypothetical protein